MVILMDQLLSTITAKGQITIPKIFRDSLALSESDKVVFTQLDEKTLAVKSASRDFMVHSGSVKAKKPLESSNKVQQKVYRKMAREWTTF